MGYVIELNPRATWLVVCSLALAGCGGTLQAGRPSVVGNALVVSESSVAACPRSPGGAGATYREALPGAVTDPLRERALSALPPAARRTALAAGLEPLIADTLLARLRAGDQPTVELLALRQQLDAALASLPPQLLAVEFEAECNIALMSAALEERADDRESWSLRFIVASLVVGGAASVVAGAWDLAGTESSGPVIVGLAGAVATTALGVATLTPPAREIVFVHERNILAPLERGADPDHLYPTFVFRMLTLPPVTAATSPRDRLVDQWRAQLEESVPSPRRAVAASLLWGEGGVYNDEVLALRRRLYEELESSVDSFSRDIDLLTATLARELNQPAVGSTVTAAP